MDVVQRSGLTNVKAYTPREDNLMEDYLGKIEKLDMPRGKTRNYYYAPQEDLKKRYGDHYNDPERD